MNTFYFKAHCSFVNIQRETVACFVFLKKFPVCELLNDDRPLPPDTSPTDQVLALLIATEITRHTDHFRNNRICAVCSSAVLPNTGMVSSSSEVLNSQAW